MAINVLRNNIEENRGSPEVVLHKKSGDILYLRSGVTSADTRVITATLNFHNF